MTVRDSETAALCYCRQVSLSVTGNADKRSEDSDSNRLQFRCHQFNVGTASYG
jgi:hypothetical protein